MKRTCILCAGVAALLLLGACAAPPIVAPVVMAPPGWVYAQYTAPLTVRFDDTEVGPYKGESKIQYLMVPLFIINPSFTWGDGSLRAAAREGGLKKVNCADYEYMQVLGLYAELKVIAYGE